MFPIVGTCVLPRAGRNPRLDVGFIHDALSIRPNYLYGLDAVGGLIGRAFSAAFPAEGFNREAGMMAAKEWFCM